MSLLGMKGERNRTSRKAKHHRKRSGAAATVTELILRDKPPTMSQGEWRGLMVDAAAYMAKFHISKEWGKKGATWKNIAVYYDKFGEQ